MQQCRTVVLLQGLTLCAVLLTHHQHVSAAHQALKDTSAAAGAGAAVSTAAPPAFCRPAVVTAAGPTNMVWGGNMLKVYHNLYYHNKKWYAVLDSSSNGSSIDAGIFLNTQLIKLPTTDTAAFQANIKVCSVPGVTLLLDFPFPAFPDNLGHWAELLLPLYSALSSPHLPQLLQGGYQHIDRLLLVNVRQQLLYSWPREVLGLALNPALPPWPAAAAQARNGDAATISSEEKGASRAPGEHDAHSSTSSSSSNRRWRSRVGWDKSLPWERPLPPIINPDDYDAWSANGWLLFENVVVLQDRYPIVSIPDETRPARPQRPRQQQQEEEGGAAAAGRDGAGAANAAGGGAADGSSAASVQQSDHSGLWASDWVVGFSTPQVAARFRAEALARHMWDTPPTPAPSMAPPPSTAPPPHPPPPPPAAAGRSRHPTTGQQQQDAKQQRQGQCSDAAATCDSSAAGAAWEDNRGGGAPTTRANKHSSRAVPASSPLSGPPRSVTVLWYPEDYPPVTNHRELVLMLEELTEPYGFKVRTVSLTMGAPFLSHMATMADTGLLVGRHGPLLASAVLLPPGAAVLELLPYKWEWRGVSTLYYNMTQSTGQLHHWAWRPLDARWCKYKQPSDARYAGWLPQECQGRDCLLVHAQAGLEVDLQAVRELLARKLPGLLAGDTVQELREPWPGAD